VRQVRALPYCSKLTVQHRKAYHTHRVIYHLLPTNQDKRKMSHTGDIKTNSYWLHHFEFDYY
jgi:hypothetical protein